MLSGYVRGDSLSLIKTDKETAHFIIDDLPIEIPKAWDRYVDEPLAEKELERLRQSINRQSPYGQTEWQIKVTQKLGLEFTLRPRRRPSSGVER